MGLHYLLSEILAHCVGYLKDLPDLAAARLVSKQLAEIIAPMLLRHVSVYISRVSLDRLEGLPQNPAIAKLIESVEINLSSYDALVAKDFSLFAKCSEGHL